MQGFLHFRDSLAFLDRRKVSLLMKGLISASLLCCICYTVFVTNVAEGCSKMCSTFGACAVFGCGEGLL